jgi:hypothetical protein
MFAPLHFPYRGDDAVFLDRLVSYLFRVLILRRSGISLDSAIASIILHLVV